jgi:carbonic anhydrase
VSANADDEPTVALAIDTTETVVADDGHGSRAGADVDDDPATAADPRPLFDSAVCPCHPDGALPRPPTPALPGSHAMQKLIDGIHAFRAETFENERERFERLAKGQSPETLFITCSDSRINPNLLTRSAPGELFILRNAGNIIPAYSGQSGGEVATIEYAVKVLGVKDIIVCGHSHCGAMAGLLEPEKLDAVPNVAAWLKNADSTRTIIQENYKHLTGEARLKATIQENVLVQIENLRTHPAVASRLAGGSLRLHGWVYKFETGEVFAYDPRDGQYALVEQTRGEPITSDLRLTA